MVGYNVLEMYFTFSLSGNFTPAYSPQSADQLWLLEPYILFQAGDFNICLQKYHVEKRPYNLENPETAQMYFMIKQNN